MSILFLKPLQTHVPFRLNMPSALSCQPEEGAEDDDEGMDGVAAEELKHTDSRSKDEELRCVLAVIRHGGESTESVGGIKNTNTSTDEWPIPLATDRTPKQKLKVKVTAEPLLALFNKYKDSKGMQVERKLGWNSAEHLH